MNDYLEDATGVSGSANGDVLYCIVYSQSQRFGCAPLKLAVYVVMFGDFERNVMVVPVETASTPMACRVLSVVIVAAKFAATVGNECPAATNSWRKSL